MERAAYTDQNADDGLTSEDIQRELTRQLRRPMGGDSGIASFALAMTSAVEDFPELAEILLSADHFHYILSPRDVIHQTLRAVQSQAIEHEGQHYPSEYLPEDLSISAVSSIAPHWYGLIAATVLDQDRLEKLEYDILHRRMQSMQVERSKAVKLTGVSLQDRFGPNPRILDIGTSQMHGPKQLMLGLPFNRTEVITSAGEFDPETTRLLNQHLRQPWEPEVIDCVDLFYPNDPLNKAWAFANSFYPSELADPQKVARYQRLGEASASGVNFAQADFSDPVPAPRLISEDANGRITLGPELQKHSYDMISTLTMLYQLSPAERRQWFANALEYLKPEGVIVISEFASPNDDKIEGLTIDDLNFDVEWSDSYAYRTYVYDNHTPEKGFQEVYVWLTARCRRVKLVGEAALNSGLIARTGD